MMMVQRSFWQTETKTEALWSKLRRPDCTRCPLHESAETVCLLGDGPTPARFMAIGEAPGEREDEYEHIPFTGAAGHFLDQVLEANDLDRDMFYVTNAAKCRPPGNRKPKAAELAACNVFLRAELRIHKPEYVLLLGDSALKATLPEVKGLMANRQRVIKRDGTSYFIALHPAAGLHRPAYKQLFRDDIAAFARLVRGEKEQAATKVHLVNSDKSLRVFLRKLKRAPVVAFDVETIRTPYGTSGEPPGTITLFGASFEPGSAYVVTLDHEEGWAKSFWEKVAALIAKYLFLPGKKLIAHNGKYDVSWFLKYIPSAFYTFDTMLAAFLLDENRSMSLENLALQELRVKPWKSDVQYRRDFPLAKYALYNAKDCDYTFRLYKLFREELRRAAPLGRIFMRLMMPAVNLFTRIEDAGIFIPEARLNQRIEEAKLEEQRLVAELLAFVPKRMREVKKVSKTGRVRVAPFNPGSSEQMARLLYSEEGLNLPFPVEAGEKARRANKGLGSTAEGPMKLLHHPITKIIERWRFLKSKVLATYFLRWKSIRDKAGFAHFRYNMIGAVTGRISSDLHQVPRDPFVRGVLSVEDEDWIWGAADFSQAEMRIAAHLSQDPLLLKIFREAKIDVHTNAAMMLTGLSEKEVQGEPRKKAKAYNFGFLYGMYERKFIEYGRNNYDIVFTMQEARQFRKAFFAGYIGIEPWHNRQKREAKMTGRVKYMDGRLRRLPDIWADSEMAVMEAERQAINSPVQGFVSDMALLTMVIADQGGYGFKTLVDKNFQWMGQMHDEVIFKVRRGFENAKCRALKYLMEHLPLKQAFGVELTVPIISEVKLGKYWGETKEWKDDARVA